MKAFLIHNNQEVIFTHNLEYLALQCSAFDESFKDLDMKNMSLYAVRARYPHDDNFIEHAEAIEYFEIASNIKKLVLEKVNF